MAHHHNLHKDDLKQDLFVYSNSMKVVYALVLCSALGTSSGDSKLASGTSLPGRSASSPLPQPIGANSNILKTANSKLRIGAAQVGKAVRSKVGKTPSPSEESVSNESASFQSQEIDYHGQAADDLSEITSPSLIPPISAAIGPGRNVNSTAPGVWIPGGQEDSRNRLANTLRYELTKPDGHLSDPPDNLGAGSLNTSPSVSAEDSAPAAWNADNIKNNFGRTANTIRHRFTSKPGEHLSDPLIESEDEQRDSFISSSSSSIVSSAGWSTGTSSSSQAPNSYSWNSVSLNSKLPSGHSSKPDGALENSGEASIPTVLPTNTINYVDPPSRFSKYRKFTPKPGQRAPNTATTIFAYPPMVTDIIAGQEVKRTGFFEPAHRLQRGAKAAGQAIQAKLKPANPGAISPNPAQSVTTSIAQPSTQATGVISRGMRAAKGIQNRFKSSSGQESI